MHWWSFNVTSWYCGCEFQRGSCRFPTDKVCHPSGFEPLFVEIKITNNNKLEWLSLPSSPSSSTLTKSSPFPPFGALGLRYLMCIWIGLDWSVSFVSPLCDGQVTHWPVSLLDHKTVAAPLLLRIWIRLEEEAERLEVPTWQSAAVARHLDRDNRGSDSVGPFLPTTTIDDCNHPTTHWSEVIREGSSLFDEVVGGLWGLRRPFGVP